MCIDIIIISRPQEHPCPISSSDWSYMLYSNSFLSAINHFSLPYVALMFQI